MDKISELDVSLAYQGLVVKQKRKDRFKMDAHFHPYYEMYFLADGERHVFVRNRTYHIVKGDLLLIPYNELHRTMDAEQSEYEKLEICFYPTFLSSIENTIASQQLLAPFERDDLLLSLGEEDQSFFKSMFFRLMEEIAQRKYGYDAQLTMLLSQILIFAERNQAEKPGKHAIPSEYFHAKASDMIQFVNKNYKNPLTLSMLAERYQYHPCYISTLFKQITGFTFSDYMNQVRVKTSQQLLMDTDTDITEICLECGFNSLSNFGRVFKRIVGKSPSDYRKSAKVSVF